MKARNPTLNNKYFFCRLINKNKIESFKVDLGSLDWQRVYESTDSNVAYNIFHNKFKYFYDKSFPLKKLKTTKTLARKPWISNGLVKSITTKNKLYKKLLKKYNSSNELKFKTYGNKLNNLLKISKKRYFAMKIECAKSDLKRTWNILNDLIRKSKTKSNYPESFIFNDIVTTDQKIISNNFNKYFTNIGINLAKSIPEASKNFSYYLNGSYIQSFVMYEPNEDEVAKLISEINPNKSCGIDLIDPFIIKQLGSTLAPISILPIFSKILERITYNRLYKYLEKMSVLSSNQYGFRKNYSTYMALIDLIDNFSQSIDNKEYTIGIFVDLSKAFDTVDHKILISKLNHYGIRGVSHLCGSMTT